MLGRRVTTSLLIVVDCLLVTDLHRAVSLLEFPFLVFNQAVKLLVLVLLHLDWIDLLLHEVLRYAILRAQVRL